MKGKKKNYIRKRNEVISFRMSVEERDKLYLKIALSGQSKQDYFIDALLHHKVNFMGDKAVFNQFKARIEAIEKQLSELRKLNISTITQQEFDTLEVIKTLIGTGE